MLSLFLNAPLPIRERVWEMYCELADIGVIQTDMHPGNVVSKEERLKLIDFECCIVATPELIRNGP